MPSEITSTPASFFSRTLRSSSANRYGGRRSRRLLGCMQLSHQFLADSSSVHGPGPAGQVHVQILPDGDLELTAVERDGHRALYPAQHRGDGGAGGPGAGRHRLPHPALEDARPDRAVAGASPERHVGPAREQVVVLDRRAVDLNVEFLQALLDLDRAL